ncbi:MAG: hypothetical protein BroJett040_06020 [Oligoflexia bacterium]|nr:MAG: hypothetical protein BroJett040_06020 [Oligoflexia bacterium]
MKILTRLLIGFAISYSTMSAHAETILSVLKSDSTIKLATKNIKSSATQPRKLIFYFASWCQFCKKESPEIEKIFQEYSKEVDVIGISGDEKLSEVESVVTGWSLSFPVYWDSEHNMKRFLKIKKIPRIIYLDSSGNVLRDQTATTGATEFFDFVQTDLKKIKK